MKTKFIGVAAFLVGSIMSFQSFATPETDFDAYVQGLKQEAKEKGISESTINSAFKNVQFKPKAVVADNNQPEKKLTLDEYIPRAVPKWKIQQAKRLYHEYFDDLKRIGDAYGVQPRFIVALWGVESNFGRFTGNYNVVEALSTLAFDGRREALFRKQTMAALQIIDEGHISADNMKGSWAGAMGQAQFMPTSFLHYAADGNGDGKKDIWTTKEDVFASTANYLKTEGWDDKYTWGRQIHVPAGINPELQGRDEEKGKYLQEWSKIGITSLDGSPLPVLKEDIKAWLIMPDDEIGRSYLVYNNYNVLMHWNRSYYFAIAVSTLADRIVQD
ncbi:Membrane-bound lytic murein transglycosylase B [Vibrio casei]|uniref:Lytic murein transglycosylase n=2 Tax=Vibrio casei TaxID=673372 RepID=A0A368LLX7_9VIBR|nr:lytic murein transglycosylase [Vibrio casei]RCS72894.1 lytic murein transglycosylase [Vibrio casei]SJN38590.1 Membrane-bound lytic murein transglycosylase B [Vibrio casei]